MTSVDVIVPCYATGTSPGLTQMIPITITHLCAAGDRSFLFRTVRCGRGSTEVDLPGSRAAGNYLADGLHRRCEGETRSVLCQRTGLDNRRRGSCLGLPAGLRVKRSRDRLLRILRVPTVPNVPDGMLAQRCWLVQREQAEGAHFPFSRRLVFGGFYLLPLQWAAGFGTIAAIASGVYSIRVLIRLVPLDRVPCPIQRLLVMSRPSVPEVTRNSAALEASDSGELRQ